MVFDQKRYHASLTTTERGRNLVARETVNSTNSYFAERLATLPLLSTVVVTEEQTAGRGRFGRIWLSPPLLNLTFSFVWALPPRCEQPGVVTLAVALALCETLEELPCAGVSIKYPNDILMGGKKVAGILTELETISPGSLALVGIGLNVNSGADDFPPELQERATSLAMATGVWQSREEILASFFNRVEPILDLLTNEGLPPLMERYRKRSSVIGREVMVTAGEAPLCGVAETIDDQGALKLRLPNGDLRTILSGEVTFRCKE